MKKVFIVLFALLAGMSMQASAQNKTTAPVEGPQFKFEGGETYDFGVVLRGPVATHKFEFTNVGNRPINVIDVTPSCGCTNVDWTKSPVNPGQKGFITLSLKTEEQKGVFNKEVYIKSDAVTPHGEKRYVLYIKGDAKDNVPGTKDQKEKK